MPPGRVGFEMLEHCWEIVWAQPSSEDFVVAEIDTHVHRHRWNFDSPYRGDRIALISWAFLMGVVRIDMAGCIRSQCKDHLVPYVGDCVEVAYVVVEAFWVLV